MRARAVGDAGGVWVDEVRAMDARSTGASHAPLVVPSQGVHLVLEREFLPSDHALLVPRTADGRVLFAVPWLGKVLVGTTDTERPQAEIEPRALPQEVAFLLRESAKYLRRAPQPADVRSCWAGLRPLVRPQAAGVQTSGVSREHHVWVEKSGLVTVTGGKWTTYRAMAEDVLEKCMSSGLLERRAAGVTRDLPLVGAPRAPVPRRLCDAPGLHLYGTEADAVQALPGSGRELAPGLTEAMVRFAARFEYARTVEDMLARRSRWLFLDTALAARAAPAVAQVLREELARDPQLRAFEQLLARYALSA